MLLGGGLGTKEGAMGGGRPTLGGGGAVGDETTPVCSKTKNKGALECQARENSVNRVKRDERGAIRTFLKAEGGGGGADAILARSTSR